MASDQDRANMREVSLILAPLIEEAVETYGPKVTLAGIVECVGTFVGALDRAQPTWNVLAAWHRAFSRMYDVGYFTPDLTSRGEA